MREHCVLHNIYCSRVQGCPLSKPNSATICDLKCLSFEFRVSTRAFSWRVRLPESSIPVFHPPTTGRPELVFTPNVGETDPNLNPFDGNIQLFKGSGYQKLCRGGT